MPGPQIERKVTIMGYRSVGKSSITVQFAEGRFPDSYDPTIANTFTRNFDYKGQKFVMHLFDTAGQDEYSLFPRSYTMDVHGYVLVYAINSRKSFDVIKVVYDKILDNVGSSHVPLVLVGNKVDLQVVEREVSTDEGKKLAEKWKAAFIETSAKDNQQVKEIFERIIFEIEKAHGNVKITKDSSCNVS